MGTKGKLSVTIDEKVLEALETASREFRMAKSTVTEAALKLWLRKRTEKLMAEGYEATAEQDKEISELGFEAQREVL